MLATISNATTDDPAMDAEIETVRHALDRSLDEKWDHFRTDFRELWGQFQTECIESSHKLVVAEKAAADERFAALKDAYDKVKAKCADFDRYNQLLQEKLDQTQAEMKSLSAVSMTIQWEKRVASKQAECERLTKQLETQKQVNTTLKRENTLLNTQLEQWGNAREAEGKAKDAAEAAAMAAETARAAAEAAAMAAETARDATEAAAVEATSNTAASLVSPAATETPKAATEPAATDPVNVEAADPATEPPVVTAEPPPTAESAALEEDTITAPAATTPEPAPTVEPAKAAAPEPSPPATPEDTPPPPATPTTTPAEPPAPPAITYTRKKLKRKKADTEKTPFLLGSDDVLYAWTEGDVPGAAVGTKTARGYKFTKK